MHDEPNRSLEQLKCFKVISQKFVELGYDAIALTDECSLDGVKPIFH